MKTPNDYESMTEIRTEIDKLDRQIIVGVLHMSELHPSSKLVKPASKLLSDFNQF